jgi:hypothetical protein
VGLEFELGLQAYKAGALLLEPHVQSRPGNFLAAEPYCPWFWRLGRSGRRGQQIPYLVRAQSFYLLLLMWWKNKGAC